MTRRATHSTRSRSPPTSTSRSGRCLPQGVQPIRGIRRAWSGRLRAAPAEAVVAVAMALGGLPGPVVAAGRPGLDGAAQPPVQGRDRRTLDICRRLAADSDDMVVKALSWALRELVVWDPEAVRQFLDTHHEVLATRVSREVRSKLETGRKHPARRAIRAATGSDELPLGGGPMNRNPEVDRWFEQAGHPLEATMWRARDIILGADDRVTESIKWKTPTFAYRGNIASFNPSKHLLSIMFHRGAEIPGDHPRLEGDGKLVRTMRFTDLGELEAGKADLEAVIRAWCDWKAAARP